MKKFDVQELYKQYKNMFTNVTELVKTRFAPEPSGYLHIGHLKAALISYHSSKIYNGKFLLRLEDTNPSNEKEQFYQSILEDLEKIGVYPDEISYSSDHFDYFYQKATELIQNNKAYLDNTPIEQMRQERFDGIESQYRNTSPEENLQKWNELIKNPENFKDYCLRGKIDMQNKNKCLRDPVFFRYNEIEHHRTKDKYKFYPTYDFACPLQDALEEITHCQRSSEYSDRVDQYKWVQKNCNVKQNKIIEFSKLNMKYTLLSKRKLKYFIDNNIISQWDDPRFPTIQGFLRRGFTIEGLTRFMLEQGKSKKTNLMEWDKIFAVNAAIIDPFAVRLLSVNDINKYTMTIKNLDMSEITIDLSQKNKQLGQRSLKLDSEVYIDYDDALQLQNDQNIIMLKIGIFKILNVNHEQKTIEAQFEKENKDFKNKISVNWVSKNSFVKIKAYEYDHLITKPSLTKDEDFIQYINKENKQESDLLVDSYMDQIQIKSYVQLERRGFYVVDKKNELIYVPNGKTKNQSTLSVKIDANTIVKGQQ